MGWRMRAQVLSKTMDSTTLTPEKAELATISRDAETGEVRSLRSVMQSPAAGAMGAVLCPILCLCMRCEAGSCHACTLRPAPGAALLCGALASAGSVATCRAIWPRLVQVIYKVYDEADLKPLLDAVNEETQKEKESES